MTREIVLSTTPSRWMRGPAFRPTAPELMRYLARFVTGHPIGSDVPILVKDLYQSNTEPWQIFPNSDEELIVLYFFTPKLPAKPLYRRHMVLGDGRGTWKLEKDRQQVIRQGNVYGYKRRFRYQNKKLPQHHDHFELKEYSLTETARAGVKGPLKDYVLCRMRRLFEVDPSTMVTDIAEIIRITSNMIGRGAAEEEEEESQDADAGEDDTQWLTLGFSSFGLPK